jgi:hypothetical protein
MEKMGHDAGLVREGGDEMKNKIKNRLTVGNLTERAKGI